MFIVSNWSKCLGMALGCLFLIFASSCGSETQYIGVYKAQDTESQKQSEIELKSDSEGVWRVDDNEESFAWSKKGDEIRLNTKQGGVIVAKIQDDTLKITLAGGKKLSFKKVE
jgi:hypothetical protein